jgi:hypothetical protein
MYSSKLVAMLRSLHKRERRRFADFAHSPYFNKHERLRAFVDYLVTHVPNEDTQALTHEAAFATLFPAEPYNEQRISDLMSYAARLLEKFLAYEREERDDTGLHLSLLNELAERRMHKPFQQQMRKLRRKHEEMRHRNEQYYLLQYRLWETSDRYFMRLQRHTKDESLQQKVDALDRFYLSAKLKNACEMVNRQHVISERYHFWLTQEVMHYLRHNIEDYREHPAILIYFHILQLLMEPDQERHFLRLKAELSEYAHYFPREEARYMYLYVQNYCIHQINKGNRDYLPELFELYQWLLDTGIIFEGDYISQWDYKNIVSAGHRMERYDWTERFIYEYKPYLPPEDRENAFNYNLAVLYYAQRAYRKAIRVLQQVHFTDVYYALGARSLLLKIYYEMEEYDGLFALIESFTVYLKRNKELSEYQQTIHLNLIRYVRKLTNLRMKRAASISAVSRQQVGQLREQIENTQAIAHLPWLERKLNELEDVMAQAS